MRGPDLDLSCSQTDDCLKYHHRTFIQQLMETEAETCIGALDLAPTVQLKSGRCENTSKEVNNMMGIPELMGAHQLQSDREGNSIGPN